VVLGYSGHGVLKGEVSIGLGQKDEVGLSRVT